MTSRSLYKLTFLSPPYLEWRPYRGESVVACFRDNKWYNIFPEISSDDELKELLKCDFGAGYIVYDKATNKTKGFTYLHIKDKSNRKIFIHGGGWGDKALFNYAAIVTMINALFKANIKIRTSCTIDNKVAYRFIRSLGFVCYYTSKHYHYFWLPYQRFRNSPITQRFIKELETYTGDIYKLNVLKGQKRTARGITLGIKEVQATP